MAKQKVALVLGSGGARGIAHIGVISELQKRGYEITSVAGTSMGALVGGIFAAGELGKYESWLCSLSKIDVFNLVDFTLSARGIIKVDKVLNEIKQFIPDRKIEDMPVKFAAVVTDIVKKEEVVITGGSLFDAIRASISIPIVITPVIKSDTVFVDGGVLNPVPTNRVHRSNNDIMIAVNVNSRKQPKKSKEKNPDLRYFDNLTNSKLIGFQKKLAALFPVGKNKKESPAVGYFNLITETSGLMLSQIAKLTLEMNPPDILIEIPRESYGTFEFYRSEEIIEEGRKAAVTELDNFEKSTGK